MISLTEYNYNKLEMGLYIVSTPIGNLSDISLRALHIFENSDYIFCEDTRVSKNLLDKYKIKTKLISNHKFNEKSNLNKINKMLEQNKIISLISDAGTPCVSDPGQIIVSECIKKKIKIFSIPGASAVTAAMSASGFEQKFFFYGFFPDKKKEVENIAQDLSKLNCSIVFFISAKKFKKKTSLIKKYFPERSIVICKEMTKIYEDYIRFEVSEIENIELNLKGEITLVLSSRISKNLNKLGDSDKKKIKKLIENSSIKDIVKIINKNKKIQKKEIYDFCLSLKNEK